MPKLADLLQGRAWLALLAVPLTLCAAMLVDTAWGELRSAWTPVVEADKPLLSDPALPVANGEEKQTRQFEALPQVDPDELLAPELPKIPPPVSASENPSLPRRSSSFQPPPAESPPAGPDIRGQREPELLSPAEGRDNSLVSPQTVRDEWQKDTPKVSPRPPVPHREFLPPEPAPQKPEKGTEELPPVDSMPPADNALEARLLDAEPWWSSFVIKPMRPSEAGKAIALPDVVMAALYHSEFIRGLSLQPLIQETDITRYQADFDPTAFIESKWSDLNDPVGNTLTTGGANRFLDSNLNNRIGIRRKNTAGGVLDFEQNAGLRDTNSIFFVPANQALTQLSVNYNQPLLRGAGQTYNQSLIVMAEIDTRLSQRDVQRQLQDHVLKVINGYWELSMQRSLYLQRLRARDRVIEIQRELEARREWDVVQSQLLRARAAIALRTAALARADAAIRNAETRLRVLTNAPELSAPGGIELVPVELPPCQFQPPTLSTELQVALSHRPEVDVALERIRSSEVRMGMACNELKPSLNLVLQSYVKGLQGNYGVLQSLGNQFATGGPSYSTGLVFEAPLGNRAAQSKYRRRTLEVQQLMHEFQNTLANVSGEVEVAIREVDATYREFLGQQRAVLATDAEVHYLLERWRHVPGHDRSATLLLEDALNAQDRLVAAEATLAQTQRDFAISIATLRRNTGVLLDAQTVQVAPPPANHNVQRGPANGGKVVKLAPQPGVNVPAAPPAANQPTMVNPPPATAQSAAPLPAQSAPAPIAAPGPGSVAASANNPYPTLAQRPTTAPATAPAPVPAPVPAMQAPVATMPPPPPANRTLTQPPAPIATRPSTGKPSDNFAPTPIRIPR